MFSCRSPDIHFFISLISTELVFSFRLKYSKLIVTFNSTNVNKFYPRIDAVFRCKSSVSLSKSIAFVCSCCFELKKGYVPLFVDTRFCDFFSVSHSKLIMFLKPNNFMMLKLMLQSYDVLTALYSSCRRNTMTCSVFVL